MKQTIYYPLEGGLDMASAPLSVPPGRMIDCVNIELGKNGKGYRFPEGYERYDGQPAPSSGTYAILDVALTGDVEAGDVVTQSSSQIVIADGTQVVSDDVYVIADDGGAGVPVTAKVVAVASDSSYLVIVNASGTFSQGWISVMGVVVGSCTGAQVSGGASTMALDAEYLNLAADYWRDSIAKVPGSGSLLGIHWYNGYLYAFRANSGNTATDMYVSSASGWTICVLGSSVAFTLGTAAFAEGETLTKGGVTSTIRRVVVTSGAWSSNNAAGFLTITGVAGGNYTSGVATSASGSATLSGAQTANAITKAGRFECINHNFGGHAGTTKMYCVNGVGKAFEYNGNSISFITTGMTTDKPTHIVAHQNHLFLAFSGGSLQNSSLVAGPLTMPFCWTAVTGASEMGIGDEITGLEQVRGEALATLCKNRTRMLFGDSSANWNMQEHSEVSGAAEWTVQTYGEPIYVDGAAITSLSASESYGGFSSSAISSAIQKFMTERIDTAVASVVSLLKSQYRVFFSDGYFAVLTFTSEGVAGFTLGSYPVVPTCTCYDNETGRMWMGDSSGYVYELDKGTSFDGASITYFMRLPFNFVDTPRQYKKFQKLVFELNTDNTAYATFNFIPDFNYMNSGVPSSQFGSITVQAGTMIWNVDTWNTHVWSGDGEADMGTSEEYIDGIATEIGLIIYQRSETMKPITINGIMLEYNPLGDKR